MKNKKWVIGCVLFLGVLLVGVGLTTAIIDPLFHYHKPLGFLNYPIMSERYQNDGIVKHLDYTAIITGTSMAENFKTSEMDELFHVDSIKVCYAGGSYKELGDNLKRAVKANNNIEIIVWGLDYGGLLQDKDAMKYDDYPEYLYNDDWKDDLNYLLNKDILLINTARVLFQTLKELPSLDFDSAHNWDLLYEYGKDVVKQNYERKEMVEREEGFSDKDKIMLQENLEQNVLSLVKENPGIDFYLFFPPYSIYYYDDCNQCGQLGVQLEVEKEAIKMLVSYKNVHLFSFTDQFDLISDLDYYKDAGHYSGKVNSWILECMSKGEHLLTEENYESYCSKVEEYLIGYDYDSLFY